MIVFPMAGASSRFAQAGYDRPKYRLDLHGRPVFDYAVAGFARYFATQPLLFICREEAGVAGFIAARVAALGVADHRVIVLPQPTAGQAETVAIGVATADVAAAEPLIVFNIDSFRRDFVLLPEDAMADGMLETFTGSGDAWSFVLPDPARPERVLRTAEKVRISPHCSNGLYYFRSRALFDEAYGDEQAAPSQPGAAERYIAPIYNQMIARGRTVAHRPIACTQTVFCGVPDDYVALCDDPRPLDGLVAA